MGRGGRHSAIGTIPASFLRFRSRFLARSRPNKNASKVAFLLSGSVSDKPLFSAPATVLSRHQITKSRRVLSGFHSLNIANAIKSWPSSAAFWPGLPLADLPVFGVFENRALPPVLGEAKNNRGSRCPRPY